MTELDLISDAYIDFTATSAKGELYIVIDDDNWAEVKFSCDLMTYRTDDYDGTVEFSVVENTDNLIWCITDKQGDIGLSKSQIENLISWYVVAAADEPKNLNIVQNTLYRRVAR